MFKTDHPAPPCNLTLSSLEPFTISWTPPFSLPGVILSYIVNITNLNTSSVFISGELRRPSFNFSGTKDGSPCDVYQFTVTARNAAGWSDPSNFTFSLPSCKLHLESMQNVTMQSYKILIPPWKHKSLVCTISTKTIRLASFPGPKRWKAGQGLGTRLPYSCVMSIL